MITIDQLKDVKERTEALERYLDIEGKKVQVEEEQLRTQAPGFWDDAKKAEAQMKKVKELQKWIDGYKEVKTLADELELSFDFFKEEMVTEEEVDAAYAKAIAAVEELELKNMLRQEADSMDCVLKINSGAGGTESQDWCEMLFRMYTRYCTKMGWKTQTIDYQEGDEAGIKSVSFSIEGNNAYGFLKSENGVHRLVRISPFDSSGRRHTSFSSCEVMPEIENDTDIVIRDEDIKMDVFRSSGAGGQHVNKTSSAVRLTHIPTGIVVACQNERSQFQNKDMCMKMLKAKLAQIKEREHLDKIEDIKGVQKEIAWGSQIRSYVFMPYTLVKDHRTGHEDGRVDMVMDGNIQAFLNAYLSAASKGELENN